MGGGDRGLQVQVSGGWEGRANVCKAGNGGDWSFVTFSCSSVVSVHRLIVLLTGEKLRQAGRVDDEEVGEQGQNDSDDMEEEEVAADDSSGEEDEMAMPLPERDVNDMAFLPRASQARVRGVSQKIQPGQEKMDWEAIREGDMLTVPRRSTTNCEPQLTPRMPRSRRLQNCRNPNGIRGKKRTRGAR